MNPFTFGGTTETRTRTVWLRARYATITSLFHSGGCGGNRTHNPRIKSPMLCQLSYTPFGESTETRTRTVWLKARYATITSLTHFGGSSGNRTHNPRIKSPMLCQLSYTPNICFSVGPTCPYSFNGEPIAVKYFKTKKPKVFTLSFVIPHK